MNSLCHVTHPPAYIPHCYRQAFIDMCCEHRRLFIASMMPPRGTGKGRNRRLLYIEIDSRLRKNHYHVSAPATVAGPGYKETQRQEETSWHGERMQHSAM